MMRQVRAFLTLAEAKAYAARQPNAVLSYCPIARVYIVTHD